MTTENKANDGLGLFRHSAEEVRVNFCQKYTDWMFFQKKTNDYYENRKHYLDSGCVKQMERAWIEYCEVRDLWMITKASLTPYHAIPAVN